MARQHDDEAVSEPMTDDTGTATDRLKAGWNIANVAAGLAAAREDWRAVHRDHVEPYHGRFPSRRRLEFILSDLSGALFPLRLGPSSVTQEREHAYVIETLDRALGQIHGQIELELHYMHGADDARVDQEAARIVTEFAAGLPALRRLLDTDVEAAYAGDPAARSVDEVLLCYPGLHATIYHRIAHRLHQSGVPLIARIIAELAHSETGIDIHPGARIGDSFFIDHGTGIVIGETAVIGNRVRLYQAVTLGARSFPIGDDGALAKGLSRHPIVEDEVVIYAGATILGRVTIGARSVIGGGVWLTDSVAPGSIISQARADRDRASGAGGGK